MCILVDLTSRYLDLARRGRATFLESAASASLFRRRGRRSSSSGPDRFEDSEPTTSVGVHGVFDAASAQLGDLEVYPLIKKPGAAFADMITVGRTGNNDVVLVDVTVSRFHAFFRRRGDRWLLCDAGSKNGTRVGGQMLAARAEAPLRSGATIRVGDVEAVFYAAPELYDILCEQLR